MREACEESLTVFTCIQVCLRLQCVARLIHTYPWALIVPKGMSHVWPV